MGFIALGGVDILKRDLGDAIASGGKNACDKMVVKTDEGEATYYFEVIKVLRNRWLLIWKEGTEIQKRTAIFKKRLSMTPKLYCCLVILLSMGIAGRAQDRRTIEISETDTVL